MARGKLNQQSFEFDRGIIAGVLGTLRGAIQEGAAQMEMVADERMFDLALSDTFSRTAQQLHRMTRKLERLLGEVVDTTGYPRNLLDRPGQGAAARRIPNRS